MSLNNNQTPWLELTRLLLDKLPEAVVAGLVVAGAIVLATWLLLRVLVVA